jgi:hypothetical protein
MRSSAAAVLAALAVLAASGVRAQVSVVGGRAALDTLEAQFRADFAVREPPALDLVDGDPSHILRPATVREVAVAAAEFGAADGSLQVPEAFAVEVAPFLLARGRRLSLAEYRARPALYRLRVSGATGRDSLGRAALALGVRATLVDGADLRTRADYLGGVTALAGRINGLVVEERLARGQRPDPGRPLTLDSLTGPRRAQLVAALAAVDSLRRAVEGQAWNARVVEVAAGARAGAADAAGNDLRLTDYAAWATYGDGIGTWGQVLVGARGALGRDDPDDALAASASLSARLYVGSNRTKAFAEAQATAGDGAAGFVQAGAEARLFDAVWTTVSTGLEWDDASPRLVGRFALKVALPDLAD